MSSRLAATAAGLSLAVAASLALAAPAQADGAAGGTSYRWVGNSADWQADNHSWTDARNWSPQGVPGTGDSVRVEGPQQACTATVDNIPTVTLSTLEVVPGISAGGSACHTSLDGSPITVTDSFLWSGGSIETDLTLAAGSTGRIADIRRAPDLHANLTVHGTLTVSGTAVDTNGDGASDTSLTVYRPNKVTVSSTGRLISKGDNEFSYNSCCVDPGRVINNGSIEVAGGTFVLDHLAFDQSGTLTSTNFGTLVSHGGIVNAAAGSRYVGPGIWSLRSTVVSRFTGTQNLSDGFQLWLGTNGSDSSGSEFGGTFAVAGNGYLGWYGGTLEAGVTVGKGVIFDVSGAATGNNARLLSGRDYTPGGSKTVSIVNHGYTFFGTGVTVETTDRANLVNASDGVMEFAPGARIEAQRCCVSPDTVNNLGKLVLGDGRTRAAALRPVVLHNVTFRNTGRVALTSGTDLQVVGGAPVYLGTSSFSGGRVLLDAPTTILGGTTLAKRTVIGLGTSTLDLRGTTSVRGFVLLTGGAVINRDQLTLSALTATRLSITGSFTQVTGAGLLLDARSTGSDLVSVGKRASIRGTVTVRNAGRWAPVNGKRTTVVAASGGVAWAGRVVTVRGYLAPRINHWVATPTARALTLTARAG